MSEEEKRKLALDNISKEALVDRVYFFFEREKYYRERTYSLENIIDKAIENCKKSIESINQKLENNKEPFEVVDGKIIYLNDYQVCRLKAIRMKCKELLEILGDKENE